MFLTNTDGADEWARLMLRYGSALKQVATKIDILNNEFMQVYHYNPIEHVKSRIKSAESIVKKLKRIGAEVTLENMEAYLSDIAGIRIICSFTSDIYLIADLISSQGDIKVLRIKNYIANPKENGYQSYHMIISVPVYLLDGPVETKVEIQIRTIAMDFWASLEHKIRYKFEGKAPAYIEEQLKGCAEIVNKLDAKMLSLNREIQAVAAAQVAQPDLNEQQKTNEQMQEAWEESGSLQVPHDPKEKQSKDREDPEI